MTTIINFKTNKKIKTQAQKIAEEMGINLSDVLNIYLRGFVKIKEIHISLNEDESKPSRELLEAVKKARKEYKKGKIKSYRGVNGLIEHLEKI